MSTDVSLDDETSDGFNSIDVVVGVMDERTGEGVNELAGTYRVTSDDVTSARDDTNEVVPLKRVVKYV